MSPSVTLKCLSTQELRINNLVLSLYKIVKEVETEFPETNFEELLKSGISNLIKRKELRKICRNSSAVLIGGDGLTFFLSFEKVTPSIQLLKVPAIVKEVLLTRIAKNNGSVKEDPEPEFTGLKLEVDKLTLSEELIAFDSILKGYLEDDIYALRIVSDKLDSVIFRDEISKYLSKQSNQSKASSKKSSKKKRKKKSKRSRKRRRKKPAKKSR